MSKKATIIADKETGVVVHQSANNPKFGWYAVEQISTVMSNGFEREVRLTAIVNGDFEMLSRNKVAGAQMDGVIIVKESTVPFNKENPDSDLKSAGDSGIPCTIGGLPIYRRTSLESNQDAVSTLLAHDNGDEIKAFYAKQALDK